MCSMSSLLYLRSSRTDVWLELSQETFCSPPGLRDWVQEPEDLLVGMWHQSTDGSVSWRKAGWRTVLDIVGDVVWAGIRVIHSQVHILSIEQ